MQITRIASPALDLNYMLYNSLTGDVRKPNMEDFHNCYYSSFSSVMAAAKRPMVFTIGQFKKEFTSKNFFGLMMACMILPIILIDSKNAFTMEDVDMTDIQAAMADFDLKVADFMNNSPLVAPRFLSLMDEMRENGMFKTNSVNKLIQSFNSM